MVSETLSKNRFDFMESYKLLELSGSESENDIIHFASYDPLSQPQSQPRKKRLKRKERDLLRSSTGAPQYESPVRLATCARCWGACLPGELLPGSPCCESLGGRVPACLDRWECLRTGLLVLSLLGLCVVTVLALHLHSRLDLTQQILDKLEASGSELPAKFHESHVRLQQLEKNHTSLWTFLSSVSNDVRDITQKMTKLETSLKALEDRLSGTPQLSSLPKDVANIQDSVATFGSSLQDVQSALKALKEGHDQLNKKVEDTSDVLSTVKSEVIELRNATQLPPKRGREGVSVGEGEPVAAALLSLRNDVTELSSVVATVNASMTSSLDGARLDDHKVQSLRSWVNDSLRPLTQEVSQLQVTCAKLEAESLPEHVANLSSSVAALRDDSLLQQRHILSLNQSIAVVKGVERKLEGSQVQMASGVTDLKQQIQKLDKRVSSSPLASSATTSGQSGEGARGRARKRRDTRPHGIIRPTSDLWRKKRLP